MMFLNLPLILKQQTRSITFVGVMDVKTNKPDFIGDWYTENPRGFEFFSVREFSINWAGKKRYQVLNISELETGDIIIRGTEFYMVDKLTKAGSYFFLPFFNVHYAMVLGEQHIELKGGVYIMSPVLKRKGSYEK